LPKWKGSPFNGVLRPDDGHHTCLNIAPLFMYHLEMHEKHAIDQCFDSLSDA
jgi:hypothetical protein